MGKIKATIFTILMMMSGATFAASFPEMVVSFSNSYDGIWKFMLGATAVIGIFLVSSSIFAWTKTMEDSSRNSMKVPLSLFFSGIIIFQIGDALKTMEDTFGMSGRNILSSAAGGGQNGAAVILAVLGFVQIIGFIAFIRGFLILQKYSSGEARDGMGRAITHIAGGVMAVNIKWTIAMLVQTFAPDMAGTFTDLGLL
jgi:hypothetical protein